MSITAQAVFKHLNPVGNPGKLPSLDGLRAFAILFVLMRHAATGIKDNFSNISTDSPFWHIALNGWLGVDLFFVLSGFLVGYHLIVFWPNRHHMHFIKLYWLKRLLRIFPLYYAIILIVILELVPLYEAPSTDTIRHLKIHLVFMQDYFGASLLIPLWSLATEEKFYFIAPFIIWGISRIYHINYKYVIGIFSLIIILSISLRHIQISNIFVFNYSHFFWEFRAPFHFSFQGLLLGLGVAYLHSRNVKLDPHQNSIFIITIIVLALILTTNEWMSGDANWQLTSIILLLININFSFMLYACITSTHLNNGWLGNSYLRFFSRLSYSLYLVHFLFIPWSAQLAKDFSNDQSLSIYIFILIYISFSIVTAYLLHVTVEKPFLYIKDRISMTEK